MSRLVINVICRSQKNEADDTNRSRFLEVNILKFNGVENTCSRLKCS